MVASLRGIQKISADVDEDGYRTYSVIWRINGSITAPNDGPATILACPGLPLPGTSWNPGAFDPNSDMTEVDSSVFCRHETSLKRQVDEPGREKYWLLTQTFSNRPTGSCSTTTIDNPLLVPQGVSGGFVKYTPKFNIITISAVIVSSCNSVMSS